MFKLSEFLVSGFLTSFKERSLGEGQVMLQSAAWYAKGTLDDADMAAIITGIEAIKAQWEAERKAQEEAAANPPEAIVPEPVDPEMTVDPEPEETNPDEPEPTEQP